MVLPCPSICTSGLQNDDFDILMKKIRDGVAENPNIDKALELYDDVQGLSLIHISEPTRH